MKPWDRKPGEPHMWYERFMVFLRLGPERSMYAAYKQWQQMVGKRLGKNTRTAPHSWKRNAQKWQWHKRAEAFDIAERQKRIEQESRERAEALRRHIQAARAWQEKALCWLKENEIDEGGLALKAWREGLAEERRALGLPEYVFEIMSLSDEELIARYRELVAQISACAGRGQMEGIDVTGTPAGDDSGTGGLSEALQE